MCCLKAMPRSRFEAWNCSRPSYHSLSVPSQSKRHQSRFLRFRTAHLEFCNASPACRLLSEEPWVKGTTCCFNMTSCPATFGDHWISSFEPQKPMDQWWMSCGDFGNPLINPCSKYFSIFSKYFNHFSWFLVTMDSNNVEIRRFHHFTKPADR